MSLTWKWSESWQLENMSSRTQGFYPGGGGFSNKTNLLFDWKLYLWFDWKLTIWTIHDRKLLFALPVLFIERYRTSEQPISFGVRCFPDVPLNKRVRNNEIRKKALVTKSTLQEQHCVFFLFFFF